MNYSKISQDKPLPLGNGRSKIPMPLFMLKALEVGESFDISFSQEDMIYTRPLTQVVSKTLLYWQKKFGAKYVVRTLKKDEDGRVIAVRIWCTEKGGHPNSSVAKNKKVNEVKDFQPYNIDGSINEEALLFLIRRVEGWLDVLDQAVPVEKQNEDLWEFIIQESCGGDMAFNEIPQHVRTPKVLFCWFLCNLQNMNQVPKEYWTKELRKTAYETLTITIQGAETEKDIQEFDEAAETVVEKYRREHPGENPLSDPPMRKDNHYGNA